MVKHRSKGFKPKNGERVQARETARESRHASIGAIVSKPSKFGPRSKKKEQQLARFAAHAERRAAEKTRGVASSGPAEMN
jgi:hypothetical protein